jgi:hypothetical protein
MSLSTALDGAAVALVAVPDLDTAWDVYNDARTAYHEAWDSGSLDAAGCASFSAVASAFADALDRFQTPITPLVVFS